MWAFHEKICKIAVFYSPDKDKKREQVGKICSLYHLTSESSPLLLSYSELLLEPLGKGCLVDMQEQIPFLVPYHLCRDIIG